MKPEAFILDTLAEAYYANGLYREALETIDQALRTGPDPVEHYMRQREKFEQALGRGRQTP